MIEWWHRTCTGLVGVVSSMLLEKTVTSESESGASKDCRGRTRGLEPSKNVIELLWMCNKLLKSA